MPEDAQEAEVLTVVPTEWEASIIVAALIDAGVQAQASGALTSAFRAEAPGSVRVLVPRDQLAQARATLRELKEARRDIDWSQVDVGQQEDEADQ
jgi:hypothetical protein